MLDQEKFIKQVAAEFDKTEVEIKTTKFRIRKLLAMEAYLVLEQVRVAVGDKIQTVDALGSTEAALAAVIASIPHDALERIRIALFKHVFFTSPLVKKALPLHPNEDQAFKGLAPIHVYQMLVRSFVVNFIDSFDEIRSYLAGAEEEDETASSS